MEPPAPQESEPSPARDAPARRARDAREPREPLEESEPLQPQDLVVTILGTYVRPYGDRVWSGGLVTLLGELGFSAGAARVALTRLVRRGLLARMREGRLVHYRLTDRADRLLAEGDRRIFSLGDPRDGGIAWTVVWHQIPEDRRLERSRLARRLRFLGFGSVQDSLWVSPHDHAEDVQQLLADLQVGEFATVFLAPADAAVGLPALVGRAWDLSGLVERYESFTAAFSVARPSPSPSPAPAGAQAPAVTELTDRQAFAVRTRLVHRFRGFPTLDPELPEELAPLATPRARAVATFHEGFEALAEPAQRHFDLATAVPGELAVSAGRR